MSTPNLRNGLIQFLVWSPGLLICIFTSLILILPPHFRSRGSTKRSKAMPLGDEKGASVIMGNLMAARCAIILLLAAARGLFWVLEQPQGSLFELHPLIQKVLSLIPTFRYAMKMGDYGGSSVKPTWLYTCHLPAPIALHPQKDFSGKNPKYIFCK